MTMCCIKDCDVPGSFDVFYDIGEQRLKGLVCGGHKRHLDILYAKGIAFERERMRT